LYEKIIYSAGSGTVTLMLIICTKRNEDTREKEKQEIKEKAKREKAREIERAEKKKTANAKKAGAALQGKIS
jgi:hypothetical protein